MRQNFRTKVLYERFLHVSWAYLHTGRVVKAARKSSFSASVHSSALVSVLTTTTWNEEGLEEVTLDQREHESAWLVVTLPLRCSFDLLRT